MSKTLTRVKGVARNKAMQNTVSNPLKRSATKPAPGSCRAKFVGSRKA
jgi:hypothetical protein